MDLVEALELNARKKAERGCAYLLLSHDIERLSGTECIMGSRKSRRLLGSFDSREQGVEYLRKHLSKVGWDSSVEGFSIIERPRYRPYSIRPVFCTVDDDGDHETVSWWDKSCESPVFFKDTSIDDGANYIMVGGIDGCTDSAHYNVDVTRLCKSYEDMAEMRSALGSDGVRSMVPVSIGEMFADRMI